MKTINCKKCNEPKQVEKHVSKILCSDCCVLIGTKEAK